MGFNCSDAISPARILSTSARVSFSGATSSSRRSVAAKVRRGPALAPEREGLGRGLPRLLGRAAAPEQGRGLLTARGVLGTQGEVGKEHPRLAGREANRRRLVVAGERQPAEQAQ